MSVPAESPPPKLRAVVPWLREIVLIGVVYLVYSFVRNQFGSADVGVDDVPRRAFHNAIRIIDLEKAIGLFHEAAIQGWFSVGWYEVFNVFYGTAHFVVTLAILGWLFVRRRESFARYRTTLIATTILALIGFALFPLMPPRLLNASPPEHPYGGGELAKQQGVPDYGFVDTLRDVGGIWSFDSKGLDSVSNQYAAMPSLHIGWSLWCTLVIWRFARHRTIRWLGTLYPFLTLTVIVATANHYIIDAAGGVVILGAGYLIASGLEQLRDRRARPAAVGAGIV